MTNISGKPQGQRLHEGQNPDIESYVHPQHGPAILIVDGSPYTVAIVAPHGPSAVLPIPQDDPLPPPLRSLQNEVGVSGKAISAALPRPAWLLKTAL